VSTIENTTEIDVINSFHSHPLVKKALPSGLEHQFFLSALAIYELEIQELGYIEGEDCFDKDIGRTPIYTLGLLMYVEFLTRELNKIEKMNGFYGKDIHMTGSDGSKRITMEDLKFELERANDYLYKQKKHSFN